jgi:hypothetical protein
MIFIFLFLSGNAERCFGVLYIDTQIIVGIYYSKQTFTLCQIRAVDKPEYAINGPFGILKKIDKKPFGSNN